MRVSFEKVAIAPDSIEENTVASGHSPCRVISVSLFVPSLEFNHERLVKKIFMSSPSPSRAFSSSTEVPERAGYSRGGDGWLMMGMIVRVIRFQSLLKVIGITGWNIQDPLRGIVR